MSLRIRPMEKKDYADYCRLIRELDILQSRAHPKIVLAPEASVLPRDVYEKNYAHSHVFFACAEHYGQVVGFVRAILEEGGRGRRFIARRIVYIDEIVVIPSSQRNNIGTSLLRATANGRASKGL